MLIVVYRTYSFTAKEVHKVLLFYYSKYEIFRTSDFNANISCTPGGISCTSVVILILASDLWKWESINVERCRCDGFRIWRGFRWNGIRMWRGFRWIGFRMLRGFRWDGVRMWRGFRWIGFKMWKGFRCDGFRIWRSFVWDIVLGHGKASGGMVIRIWSGFRWGSFTLWRCCRRPFSFRH